MCHGRNSLNRHSLVALQRPFGEEVVMTAQHAPHTPLWRRVLSLPHTLLGWLAVALTAVPLLSMLDLSFGNALPSWVGAFLITSVLAGAVVGLLALLRSQQERSVLVWLAMVPAALLALIPIVFMAQFLSYQASHNLSIVTVLPLVGMTAGVAVLHFVQRGTERYGLGGTVSSAASLIGVALIVGGALIGRASQNWLLGTNLMGVGLWTATLGLAALAIVTLQAGVVPWWGGVALIVGNPLGGPVGSPGGVIPSLLFSFLPESHNAHDPASKLARIFDLTGSAEQWLDVGWGLVWGVGPWVVVGFAVLLAARRLTVRPARVR
jgi:hypothetical protein